MSRKALFLAAAGLASCTAGPRTVVPDAGSQTLARLHVTVTSTGGDVTVGTEARLLRFRNLDAESAQILAGATAPGVLAPGRCQLVDRAAALDDALATTSPDAAVQMLDAGDLLVRIAGQIQAITPRDAEGMPFVAGTAYLADPLPLGEVGPDAYVSAGGGEDVGRFDAHGALPAMPHVLAFDGGALRWEGTGDEPVELLLDDEAGGELRCTAADTGKFDVPAAELARIGRVATVSVERTRRLAFAAQGVEVGEVVLGVRDVVRP